ncbi:ATP-binding protein [Hydrogenophaga sp.]|uniref:Lon protease family protein n=1 Tax=Hydrogenophaga sp. TaxID=1904254 RepID=UPI00286D9A17|nr:ATP-binding protein [Hydrogenophaga sp.]
MPTLSLSPEQLRLTIDPAALAFADTSELLGQPLPWIGQERAEKAARFGLAMDQPDYHLFVLGEVGSGRASLLRQLAQTLAADRPVPPDLCYLHHFDAPERPRALRMPAGQGRELRQLMAQLVRFVQTEIPQRLGSEDFKAESDRLQSAYRNEEAKAYAELDAFADARGFNLYREAGHLVFTLIGEQGSALTETEARALSKDRRAEIDLAEQALREEISRFLDKTRPMLRVMNEGLASLRRQVIKPMLDHELQAMRVRLKKQIKDSVKLGSYLDQVEHDLLEHIELFVPQDSDDEVRQEALAQLLLGYRVNLVVDNAGRTGAPVIVEDNPVFHNLFGRIEYQADEDVMMTDFHRVRAGSLLRAHGGFLLLHLRDLVTDEQVWEKLRRFMRSGRVQIEEPGSSLMPMAAVSLQPEAVDVETKLILVGSIEDYYALQEADPEFARHFRVKVDFAESFPATAETRAASAVFVAHTCARLGLPHLSAAAVARLLEDAHREVDDQARQSAIFARTEALVAESAALCRARQGTRVEVDDVDAALAARRLRHDYPEQRLRESIAEGERLISLQGSRVGQINGLTQIDLGDWRFGLPVRVSARTHAGTKGLLNIEREVEMSGPIHDKGVLILHSYLTGLFGHLTPLALNASIVFEQEYHGVEGDSASCAELFALLSSLSGVPLRQGIAVTGALNQHGEVLPVGGVNEKIEGWFRVCAAAGLDGQQGVLLPQRNLRHLMLDREVVDAVAAGRFHIHTAAHAEEGLALLTGVATGLGEPPAPGTPYPADSVLGRCEQTLRAYREACQQATASPRRRRPRS